MKKLEGKHFITRRRSEKDERSVIVHVTEEGMAMRDKAAAVPAKVGSCLQLDDEDAKALYRICYQILQQV